MTEPLEVEIFYDYACPYVHAASVWVRNIEEQLNGAVHFTWRFFPLEQVNSAEGPEWKLWETGPEHHSRTRESMRAAAAAMRQGEDKFNVFNSALLDLRHVDDKDQGRKSTINAAAETAGLDLARFTSDLEDKSLLRQIGEDYEYARNELGVFGTPTFVFPDRSAAYIKMRPAPEGAEALKLWNEFAESVQQRSWLSEIKRPTPPQ